MTLHKNNVSFYLCIYSVWGYNFYSSRNSLFGLFADRNPPELRWVKAQPPRTRLLWESGGQVTKRGGISALSTNSRLNESVLRQLLLGIRGLEMAVPGLEKSALVGCTGPGVFGVMSDQFVVMSAHVVWS